MTAVNYINILRGHALLHAVQSLGEFKIGLTTGTFGSLLLILQEKTMLWSDSNAWEINACSSSWAHLYVSAFAPFAILKRTLRTLEEDQATAILIAPCWPTACWFPRLLPIHPRLLPIHPRLLPIHPRLLQHPQLPHHSHPSVKTMMDSLAHLRERLQSRGLSDETITIIFGGWAPSTHRKCKVYIKKWQKFCLQRQLIPWRKMSQTSSTSSPPCTRPTCHTAP